MFDWDDLRIFLVVARTRRIAPAARGLGVDPTTVQRRLSRLSERLGATLFETINGERHLTERGKALFQHAESIESATREAVGDVGGETSQLAGQVRLSVAEGFASWIIAPSLPAFQAAHPEIQLDLITSSGFLNPSKREADMAVMLARPRTGRLTAVKLGNYHLRLYAAQRYLAEHDVPALVADLKAHPLIGYVPDFLDSPELDYIEEVGPGLEASLRSTSISVQHRMVAAGVGIGVLPIFIGGSDASLVPVLSDSIRIERSFWLVTHNDRRTFARIQAVGQWLQDAARALAA